MSDNFDLGSPYSLGIDSVLDATVRGDFRRLVTRLRDPEAVLGENEREFLADFLEGKVKLRRGRREDKFLNYRQAHVYETYYWLTTVDGWPKDAARHRCHEIHGRSLRTIQGYLKEFERRGYTHNTLIPIIDKWKRGERPDLSRDMFESCLLSAIKYKI